MRTRFLPVPAAVLAWSLLTASPASASVTWNGDATQGTGVFHVNECDAPGELLAVSHPERGEIWRYTKPSGDNRCETRGIRVGGSIYEFQNNQTYWLGWDSQLDNLVDNNAVFQWKSYPNASQNWPVVLKMIGGRITMIQAQPDGVVHTVWSASVQAGQWNRFALGIHTSSATLGGWVELYFNGTRQTFSDGSTRWACRTWDSANEPKWGVYGATSSSVTNRIDSLKLGTTYADVD